MEENNQTEFEIQVSITDATDEELDRSTRQLLAELRELDVESAELTKRGSAPLGTKSADPVIMGNIAVAMISNVLPKVVEVVQAWSTRGQERTVKFEGKIAGYPVKFEGSPEDLQR